MSQVNVEILRPPTQLISLNDPTVRYLAGVPSGTISMQNLQGKTYRITVPYTFTSSGTTVSINVSTISGYVSGISDVVVTINGGVAFNASSTGNYGFYLYGGTTGDTITVNNYGTIYGAGGAGGLWWNGGGTSQAGNVLGAGHGGTVYNPNPVQYGGYPGVNGYNGGNGGPAMYASVGSPVTFNNYGLVTGGGGGGSGYGSNNAAGGAGGTGGTGLDKSSNFTFLLVSQGGTFGGGGGGGSGWGNRNEGQSEGGTTGQNAYISYNPSNANFGPEGVAGQVSNYNGTKIYNGYGSWYI
jgi:hypothetical protein